MDNILQHKSPNKFDGLDVASLSTVGGVDNDLLPTTTSFYPSSTSGDAAGAQDSYVDHIDSAFLKWPSLILLVVGLFGNLLCFFVFTRPHMRKNATFIYLACLSLVDLCALLTGLGDIVLISFFRLIVREQSVYICRISTFLLYSSTHLSSFLLASVSIDRAIATNFIQLAKKFSKPQTAYTIILVSTLVAVFLNFHFLLFLGYRIDNYQELVNNTLATTTIIPITPSSPLNSFPESEQQQQQERLELEQSNNLGLDYLSNISSPLNNWSNRGSSPDEQQQQQQMIDQFQRFDEEAMAAGSHFYCASDLGTPYDIFQDTIFKWIDLLSYAILPFFTMTVCTALIIRVLVRSNKRLTSKPAHSSSLIGANNNNKQMPSDPAIGKLLSVATAHAVALTNINGAGGGGGSGSVNGKVQVAKSMAANRARTNKAKHLSYTLLTLNIVFICLVGPLVIARLVLDSSSTPLNKMLNNVVYLLSNANHALNFVMYACSLPPYRESLVRLFRTGR